MISDAAMSRLAEIVAEDGVEGSPPVSLLRVAPSVRVRPRSFDEVAAVLGLAHRQGLAVAPMGSGTKAHLGRPPTRLDVLLDLTALSGVVEYEPADMMISVLAGTRLDTLHEVLAQSGQAVGLEDPWEAATVGGALSAGSSGPRRLRWGTGRDNVLGLTVARADGSLTRCGGRVVKNVAGYDLRKLYVGSLGTLGVILQANFKARPLPAARRTVVVRFAQLEAAHGLLRSILKSPLEPVALELVSSDLPPLAEPDEKNGARPAPAVVLETQDVEASVQRQAREVEVKAAACGAREVSEVSQSDYDAFWRSLRALPAFGCVNFPLVVKLGVPLARTVEAVASCTQSAATCRIPLSWSAHAGNGIIWLYAGDGNSSTRDLRRMIEDVYELVERSGGHARVEWAPALVGSIDPWGPPRADRRLMAQVKATLDPKGLLNPGRFVV